MTAQASLQVQAADELLAQAKSPPWESGPEEETQAPVKATQAPVEEQRPSSEAKGVRWEEMLAESKERYYHEVATGKTQWELPSEGWVSLLDDDGSKYYWDPVAGTTTWDPPGH